MVRRRILASGFTVLLVVSAAGLGYADTPVQRRLLGGWAYVSGDAPFEQMAFGVERGGSRVFQSWLHERPEHTGRWSWKGDKDVVIRVRGATGFDETMRVVRLTERQLVVRFRGQKRDATFRRAGR